MITPEKLQPEKMLCSLTNKTRTELEVRLGKADENSAKWADSVSTLDLYLSVITIQRTSPGALVVH